MYWLCLLLLYFSSHNHMEFVRLHIIVPFRVISQYSPNYTSQTCSRKGCSVIYWATFCRKSTNCENIQCFVGELSLKCRKLSCQSTRRMTLTRDSDQAMYLQIAMPSIYRSQIDTHFFGQPGNFKYDHGKLWRGSHSADFSRDLEINGYIQVMIWASPHS